MAIRCFMKLMFKEKKRLGVYPCEKLHLCSETFLLENRLISLPGSGLKGRTKNEFFGTSSFSNARSRKMRLNHGLNKFRGILKENNTSM